MGLRRCWSLEAARPEEIPKSRLDVQDFRQIRGRGVVNPVEWRAATNINDPINDPNRQLAVAILNKGLRKQGVVSVALRTIRVPICIGPVA